MLSNLDCPCDCAIARPSFIYRFYATAAAAFSKTAIRPLLSRGCCVYLAKGNQRRSNSIDLFGAKFDDSSSKLTVLLGPLDESPQLRGQVLTQLAEAAFPAHPSSTTFDAAAMLAVWCHVLQGDSASLSRILGTLKVPACYFPALLSKSVSVHSPECVAELLKYGAHANGTLRYTFHGKAVTYRPITKCASWFFSKMIKMGQLGRPVDEVEAQKMCEIMKMLLAHGPVEFNSLHDDGWAVLAIDSVAFFSPVTAELFIESFVNNSSGRSQYRPLDVSFGRISFRFRSREMKRNPFTVEIAARVLYNCILALLRAGCRSENSLHDLLVGERFAFSALLEIGGQALAFGDLLINFCIEAAAPPSDGVSFNVTRLDGLPPEVQQALRARFPRRLQSLCRNSILQKLPIGIKARQNAIVHLNLPDLLTRYLNFNDLDK